MGNVLRAIGTSLCWERDGRANKHSLLFVYVCVTEMDDIAKMLQCVACHWHKSLLGERWTCKQTQSFVCVCLCDRDGRYCKNASMCCVPLAQVFAGREMDMQTNTVFCLCMFV